MALSAKELNQISSRNLATPNRKYYGDNEKIYIGTDKGRLRLLDKSEITPFKPTVEVNKTNVQDAIEEVSQDIVNLTTVVNNNFITQNIAIEEAKCLSVVMALIL